MRRRLLLLGLLLPGPALAQGRRRRAAPRPAPARPQPVVDPAPRPGLAPVPDRRFPTLNQAAPPEARLRPVVPTAPVPTRGASFTDRDAAPEAQRGAGALRPEPGVSLTLPLGR
ncbi:hypothetical protein ACI6QG_08780 [Roseococcus sp. DSY-14]|uniref:hypothetical protein n=1 Tax=Roseococcus sp. DSY-14 TaxID=3369650 RepID=UPI00387B020B